MTPAFYFQQDLDASPAVLSLRAVESEALACAEQKAAALMTFMASMAVDKDAEAAVRAEQEEFRRQRNAYLRNKYGDEYAGVDELGFETTCMGLRADQNHVF